MDKPFAVGDKVLCRFFNMKKQEFYSREWAAEILEVDPEHTVGDWPAPYRVTEPVTGEAWLMFNEVLGAGG